MNKNRLYKYINYVLSISIGFGALFIVYFKLKDNFFNNYDTIKTTNISLQLIFSVFVLMFFNWFFEALKWKLLIKKYQNISIIKALNNIFTAITIGLITPNRVVELPARVWLLPNKNNMKELLWCSIYGSVSQNIITLILGIFGLLFSLNVMKNNLFLVLSIGIISLVSLIYIYFDKAILNRIIRFFNKFRKVKLTLLDVQIKKSSSIIYLLLSFIRYLIFYIQFILLFNAFGISFVNFQQTFLIFIYFLVISYIPTFLFSEIGVRSSVAILVFTPVSGNYLALVYITLILWTINVAIPALLGIKNLHKVNIIKYI